ANVFGFDALTFDYDTALFTKLDNAGDGKLHLRAKLNATGRVIDTVVKAAAPNGLVSQLTLHVRPTTVAPPVVVGAPAIAVAQNTAALNIVYDHPQYNDWSTIT